MRAQGAVLKAILRHHFAHGANSDGTQSSTLQRCCLEWSNYHLAASDVLGVLRL